MEQAREELNRLTYETSQIYQLMRILVLVISENTDIREHNEELFYPLDLAQIIADRLEPISNQLDILWLSLADK